MFIVVEGLDGAGKSTQVSRLKDWLRERGDLEYIHFPRYDAPVYGDLIGRFLQGRFGSIDKVHPQLVALLFAEDRHGAAPQLQEALAAGKTVLLDRYVYSNIAYQCAKLSDPAEREELRQWIFRTEFGPFGLPRPDVNLFLDVPISFVASHLVANRTDGDRSYLAGAQDIHEADIRFQQTVREMYLEQVRQDPHFLRVDCSAADGSMLPPDEIFARVIQRVEAFAR